MATDKEIDTFFSQYDEPVFTNALKLRKILLTNLPDISEQIDITAKIVAYCYGQRYSELICVIIPSKKGLKFGFNKGVELPDPDNLLEGTGKISRYVPIKTDEEITSLSLKKLVGSALRLYKQKQLKK